MGMIVCRNCWSAIKLIFPFMSSKPCFWSLSILWDRWSRGWGPSSWVGQTHDRKSFVYLQENGLWWSFVSSSLQTPWLNCAEDLSSIDLLFPSFPSSWFRGRRLRWVGTRLTWAVPFDGCFWGRRSQLKLKYPENRVTSYSSSWR